MRPTIPGLVMLMAALAACGPTTRGTTAEADPGADHRVEDISLSETNGEIGRPFRADITWRDNYIDDPEISVTGLPPGLELDLAERAIVGTPTQDGFFTIQVAIRKRRPDEKLYRPRPDDRWWPAEFELSIYRPVE
jgi:hypothetical protein